MAPPPADVSGVKVANGAELKYGSVLDGQVLKRVGNEIIGIGAEPIPPPVSPALFSEDFETGWLISDIFTQIFSESFEIDWFIIHLFNLVKGEDFESGWFISNLFNSLFIENFEGVW